MIGCKKLLNMSGHCHQNKWFDYHLISLPDEYHAGITSKHQLIKTRLA
jgi:hypothetical protein